MKHITRWKLFLSFVLFIFVCEGLTSLYLHLRFPWVTGEMVYLPDNIRDFWRKLPYKIPLKDGSLVRKKISGGEIFRHPFTISPDSSRGGSSVPSAKHGLYFVGCSFTFGTGVRDEETLPAQVERNLSDTKSYNFGVSGSSPLEVLLRMQNLEPKDIREPKKKIIYTFITDHLRRHFWTVPFTAAWGYQKMYYTRSGDRIEAQGVYSEVFPLKTRFIRMLLRSGIYRMAFPYGRIPADESLQNDFLEVVNLMNRRASELGAEFIVAIWPGSTDADWLIKALPSYGIKVLDFSKVNLESLVKKGETAYIPLDQHPSASGYEIIGRYYADALRGTFNE